ncbi:thiamine phosphate synthase [uncultured Brevundimonas sp.]|uniref:thiamine phosphate synthase n=1 Tax=uncultured Brevundimonas sp. TaxID=213418 RepID=UPI002614C5AB|nr:thiamine phosphate synthase [uncultured Brevundimonas sp.]
MAREPQVPPRPTCQLYLITPPSIDDLGAFAVRLDAALAAGEVAAVQIRLKPATDDRIREAVAALKPVCHRYGVPVLLNDRPDLAKATDCDGVHVGQEDTPVKDARRIMGEDAMVGATCHDSRHLAMEAAEAGADYVAFGAFFPTDTKETTHRPELDILTIWQETMETPCVAIGGIGIDTAAEVARAGADFIAVSGAVWNHPEGEAAAVKALVAELNAAF